MVSTINHFCGSVYLQLWMYGSVYFSHSTKIVSNTVHENVSWVELWWMFGSNTSHSYCWLCVTFYCCFPIPYNREVTLLCNWTSMRQLFANNLLNLTGHF
jgi:hypothetical protein